MTVITYIVPLLILGGAASVGVLLFVLWRRSVTLGGPEVVGFLGVAVGATTWAWAYALQLRASTLPAILAYNDLLWLGTGVVGASWPIFAFAVAGDDHWLTRRRIPFISGVPLAFAVLAISNPAHELIYTDVALTTGEVVRSTVTPGVGFRAFLLWSFAVDIYVLWRLARSVRRSTGIVRSRRLAVFGAGLLPMIAGVVSVVVLTGGGPRIDFTPAMFAVTTVITGVAITRYRLLDSIAVAQDHIVTHLSDPVVVVDGDEAIRATNEAATRLFEEDDPIGRPIDETFHDQPALVESIRTRQSSGTTTVTATVESAQGDGEQREENGRQGSAADRATDGRRRNDREPTARPRTFEVSVGSLDRTDATVLVFRDVTERLAAERRAEVLNRVLRHDLRNDISVIDGYLTLLEEELSDSRSDAAREALDVLAKRTDGMLSVVEQAALAETLADGSPEFKRFDLTTVVRERCEQVRAEQPEVRLETSLPDDAIAVSAVAVFPSVVDNLIENAIEHADDDRPRLAVRLDADPATSTVELRIEDEGPGIPADDRAVLVGTEPSLENANGLGLWLINRITTISGGSVDATDRDGGGTIVTVTLPLAETESAPAAAEPTA
ncbi:histidine kinase N-terminal 7TM domain-containing protein [Halobaculum rubrum]|uniref:histidine kinase N-terminal 7TM domain-containing protein n=1 Tax=Halobaculum rubrum TaxID=2872158 RepID=UPI001CA3F8FC|nr:histidine kinase N-terminal 7TM domain-containing protein [Halobaculum rubrum]QZX98485.1 ATP-binding protein [Halobaculum rubrum]